MTTSRAPLPPDLETTNPNHGHRWRPGQSGNPSGRPRGSRHAALLAVEAMGQAAARDLMRRAIELAMDGDVMAIKMLLDRLYPVPKGRVVRLVLPDIKTASDLPAAIAAVVQAVADAQISPEEGAALTQIMEAQRRTIETADLEKRLTELEERYNGK